MIRQALGAQLSMNFHTTSQMGVAVSKVASVALLVSIDTKLLPSSLVRPWIGVACRAPKPLGWPLLLYRAWKFGMFSQTVLLVHERVRMQVRRPFGSIIHAI